MKQSRNNALRANSLLNSYVVRLVTTLCVLIYSVVPSFAYCTCRGICLACDPAAMPKRASVSEESASYNAELKSSACCQHEHEGVDVAKPCCHKKRVCSVKRDKSCCGNTSIVAPCKRHCPHSGENAPCCVRFFKASANVVNANALGPQNVFELAIGGVDALVCRAVSEFVFCARFRERYLSPPHVRRHLELCVLRD